MFGRNLRSLYFWRRIEDEVDDELDFHMEMRVKEFVGRGMEPTAARELARRRFGDLKEVRRTCAGLAIDGERSRYRLQWLGELSQDARYALRQLARGPLFTMVAVATLAIGIGANTAIFSVLNTVYFRPLPFRDADRLYRVSQFTLGPDGTHRRTSTSGFALEAILERVTAFEDALGQRVDSVTMEAHDLPERVSLVSVSPRWAGILGVTPIAGRNFSADEHAKGIDSGVTILSYSLAIRRFATAERAIGSTVSAGGRAYEVVGVYPPGFHYPYEAELWTPVRFRREDRQLNITARLRPGATIAQANRELKEVSEYLAGAAPAHRGSSLEGVSARETLIDGEARVATALMLAVGFVLLIACANLAMLLTTRYIGRRHEVAIRAALGGGRFRQLRQFVTESAVIFALGAGAGLLLLLWLRGYLRALIPEDLRAQLQLADVAIDWRVVMFTALLAAVSGVVFGAVAAYRATAVDPMAVLRDSRSTGNRLSRRTLDSLAAAEIALAIALLTSAGLMAQSFERLQRRDPGFDPRRTLTLQTDLAGPRYADGSQRLAYIEAVLARLEALPGVSAVGLTTDNPLCCGDWGARVVPEGFPLENDQVVPVVAHRLVTPDYFRALGVRLLRGRCFSETDTAGSQPVAIIDERMASHFWPGTDPIGRRIKRGPIDSNHPWLTIVGIVSNVRPEGDYDDTWFLPYAQNALGPSSETLYWMIRTEGDPLAMAPSVRAAMTEADRTVAQAEVTTMEQLRLEGMTQDRLGAIVIALFAGFGLLLAALGVYGVMAYSVRQRENEIGVRLALGAASSRILADVLQHAAVIVAFGIGLGVAGALLAGQILAAMLVEVNPMDPLTTSASVAALGVVALGAAAIPAFRAIRIDPVVALRS